MNLLIMQFSPVPPLPPLSKIQFLLSTLFSNTFTFNQCTSLRLRVKIRSKFIAYLRIH